MTDDDNDELTDVQEAALGTNPLIKDTDGDGRAETKTSFANYIGTGIAIKGNYLYAASNKEVFKYALNDNGDVVDENAAATIVTGLVDKGQHNSKSITLDNAGNIYVNVGAPSNSCQEK